jgi:hypothetical protein
MKIPLLNFEIKKNPQFEGNCFIKKDTVFYSIWPYGQIR